MHITSKIGLREVKSGCAVLAILALSVPASWGQPLQSGPQVATFFSFVDDTDQPYGLYIPKNFDDQKKYPLVVSLHGAFSNHRLNLKRVFGKGNKLGETDAEATRYFPSVRDVEYIVASPLARGTMGYQGIAEEDVYAVLEDVKKRFRIDEERVYLTGLSMGGGGTLWLALTRPDVWAAIAPVCPAPPAGTEPLAGNALNYPVKLFQGEIDPLVKAEQTRGWHKRFQELGTNVEYVEFPGVKHNSWDNAYADGAIFDWFAKYKRNAHPDRVRFATWSYKHPKAYWVTFDSFVPSTLASIDAKITGANKLEIATSNLDGFTLTLDSRKPWTVTVDGTKLTARELSFRKQAGVWKMGKASAPAKKVASIAEALGKRHIYIYGTADDPEPAELARRREEAQKLAEWGTPRTPLLLTLKAMADREVQESDLATGANLVLLGNPTTNSLIAKYSDTFPLRLRADAADYSLVFVAPVSDRHVVVMSGRPFPTTPRPFQPNPFQRDYILMRGTETLATGSFTGDWKLSETLPNVVGVKR
jgi:pimeloyl-ACP methyl ester carboxylesterase